MTSWIRPADEQLHPLRPRRDDLDRPNLGTGGQDLGDEVLERLRLDRLGDVPVGVLADRAQERLRGVVRRHHHDPRPRGGVAEPAQQLQAVHPRHPDVEEDEVEAPAGDAGEGRLSVGGGVDAVARRAQLEADQLARRAVIVDDEDLRQGLGILGSRFREGQGRWAAG
jgi:hypothetical protein